MWLKRVSRRRDTISGPIIECELALKMTVYVSSLNQVGGGGWFFLNFENLKLNYVAQRGVSAPRHHFWTHH